MKYHETDEDDEEMKYHEETDEDQMKNHEDT